MKKTEEFIESECITKTKDKKEKKNDIDIIIEKLKESSKSIKEFMKKNISISIENIFHNIDSIKKNEVPEMFWDPKEDKEKNKNKFANGKDICMLLSSKLCEEKGYNSRLSYNAILREIKLFDLYEIIEKEDELRLRIRLENLIQ